MLQNTWVHALRSSVVPSGSTTSTGSRRVALSGHAMMTFFLSPSTISYFHSTTVLLSLFSMDVRVLSLPSAPTDYIRAVMFVCQLSQLEAEGLCWVGTQWRRFSYLQVQSLSQCSYDKSYLSWPNVVWTEWLCSSNEHGYFSQALISLSSISADQFANFPVVEKINASVHGPK